MTHKILYNILPFNGLVFSRLRNLMLKSNKHQPDNNGSFSDGFNMGYIYFYIVIVMEIYLTDTHKYKVYEL